MNRRLRMTPPRSRVLEVVLRAGSVPPTIREVSDALGISHNAVHELVERLARDGFVRRDRGVYRGVALTAIPVLVGNPAHVVEWIPLGEWRGT